MEYTLAVTRTISVVLPFGIVIGLMIGYSLFGGSGSSGRDMEDR